jgi:hypothetical protein
VDPVIGAEGPPCPACGMPLIILPRTCPACGRKRLVHADTRTSTAADRVWACRADRCGQGHLTLQKVPA